MTAAKRAAAYYAHQAEVYAKVGLDAAADRCRTQAALATANAGPCCSRCGARLHNPDSIARGLGPVCEHKAVAA